jgi:tetratricopeptide (TPR) repeat protein
MRESRLQSRSFGRLELKISIVLWVAILPLNAQIMTRDDVQKQIGVYEEASRHTSGPSVPPLQAGRTWWRLGTLYQDAGMYGKAEPAFERALRLLEVAPVSVPDLATAIDDFGTLYLQMGNVKEAERAELKALKMRDQANIKEGLPKSWYHLAILYLHKHRSRKAREFAERSVTAFSADPNAIPEDKIGSLLVLSSALCQQHRYVQAITNLQSTLRITRETYGPDRLPTGMSGFLLGYAYWKNRDFADASDLMQRGTEILGKELGWGHPAYLAVMTEYAHFLRAEHRQDLARTIEQQVENSRAELSAKSAYGHGLQTLDITALSK